MTVELVRASAHDSDVLFAARVSTQGEQTLEKAAAGTDATDRDRGLINYLMRDRHGSPFEHNSMTFYVQAPIFVFREFMRHRIASYNEESGPLPRAAARVLRAGPGASNLVQVGKPGAYDFIEGTPEQTRSRVSEGERGRDPRLRVVPADAGRRHRARGRPHGAARCRSTRRCT